jgi:signal transduction histidine kinase
VRRALLRARRSRSKSSFVESGTQPTTADELVARYSRVLARGEPDVAAALRTVALEAQGLAVAEFAHALKNIIQRVLTPANQIKRRLGKEERQRVREPLKDLKKATDSLRSFSTNLSWLAQGKKLPFIETTLQQVVRNVEVAVKPVRGIAVRTSCGPNATFEAVPTRLEEALTNILRNAVEASPDGGTVRLDAYPSQDGEEVVFVIQDQGPGIPREDVETWFQLGRTSKQEEGNTGLGLFIARNFIEFEHGGSILVEEADPHGAAFRIRVPTRQGGPSRVR